MIDIPALFQMHPREAAPLFLGTRLTVTTNENESKSLLITETEAYAGIEDAASHAGKKMSSRNAPMYGEVGRSYVYLIYGMHHCLNVVCHAPGTPGAVLIRAGLTLDTHAHVKHNDYINGPGRVCTYLGINRLDNGVHIGETARDRLSLTAFSTVNRSDIDITTRIGITKGTDLPWRFVVNSRWLEQNFPHCKRTVRIK